MIKAKKSLGQNFLVDKTALRRIVDAAGLAEGDTVVEIGPGTGLLTKELLTAPLRRLVAYEVDDRAIDVLRLEIDDERFELRHEDFLGADISTVEPEALVRVVGNIPYYITSPILFKLIDDRKMIRTATLLVQLEVAERLTATPRTKEYGIPSVLANYFGEVKFLFRIPAGAFRPIPKVDSALISIDFTRGYFERTGLRKPADFDDEAFRKLVRTSFAMRRKMLRNNLKSYRPDTHPGLLPFLPRRAEELSVEEFIHLYDIIVS